MKTKRSIDYSKAKTRREVLIRQRRELWTPEQVASLAKHFRLKPGMKLLDVGCGYGYALRTWGRYCLPGGRLVGLDREKKLLIGAKRFCRREGPARVCEFEAGDVYALPFPDGEFDFTLAHVVFCHLKEPEKALDEMIRVTRPAGGVAVFDNALGGGGRGGWSNWHSPTIRESLRNEELGLRSIKGRRKLGFGDFDVGCRIPAWLEQRGMDDVGVRMNERVYWIAPPYRSIEQQTAYHNTLERLKEKGRRNAEEKDDAQLLAGGCTKRQIRTADARGRILQRRFRRAIKSGTAALAWSGPFWCIWGFKPRRRIIRSTVSQ
jgi:SAM-dependent methyltransferase